MTPVPLGYLLPTLLNVANLMALTPGISSKLVVCTIPITQTHIRRSVVTRKNKSVGGKDLLTILPGSPLIAVPTKHVQKKLTMVKPAWMFVKNGVRLVHLMLLTI